MTKIFRHQKKQLQHDLKILLPGKKQTLDHQYMIEKN